MHGLVRRSSNTLRKRIDSLFDDKSVYEKRLFLHYGDLDDTTTIRRILVKTQPDEVYHLAGQSHVGASFEIPESTCQFTAMGTLKLLEIIRDLEKRPKFLHISSSEIFGTPKYAPQDEQTPMRAVSPYGVAKAFATQMVRVYRESFGLFACNAICYNHESPRRGESFVTRKITRAVAAIKHGHQEKLLLGPVSAKRDWGYAPEYVDAMHRMVLSDTPNDYILATGRQHSVEEFLQFAFESVGLNYLDYVEFDERHVRPTESRNLCGNPEKAHQVLGWKATTSVAELASIMVENDCTMYHSSSPF